MRTNKTYIIHTLLQYMRGGNIKRDRPQCKAFDCTKKRTHFFFLSLTWVFGPACAHLDYKSHICWWKAKFLFLLLEKLIDKKKFSLVFRKVFFLILNKKHFSRTIKKIKNIILFTDYIKFNSYTFNYYFFFKYIQTIIWYIHG
jgi:hypothetical protein